jgi:hypothetical protein
MYSSPTYITHSQEALDAILHSSVPRFPVHGFVTYNAGSFLGQGMVWNFSCSGWRLSGDLPMRIWDTLSLIVTLPNNQYIEILQAVVRWSRGQEFAVETVRVEPDTQARLQQYVQRLLQEPAEMVS